MIYNSLLNSELDMKMRNVRKTIFYFVAIFRNSMLSGKSDFGENVKIMEKSSIRRKWKNDFCFNNFSFFSTKLAQNT